MIAAVVPIKSGAQVKSRLSDVLSADERRGLAMAMAGDVLDVLAQVKALDRRLVITGDEEAGALAVATGAWVMPEPEPVGYRDAAQAAVAELGDEGADSVLCLPADLPLLAPEDVQAVLDALRPAPSVVLAPSRDEGGTNAIAMAPPDLLGLMFGPDSFRRHCGEAKKAGLNPTVLRRPGLALDIDTVDDLRWLIAQGARGRTGAYLERSGIIRRIGTCGAQNRTSG